MTMLVASIVMLIAVVGLSTWVTQFTHDNWGWVRSFIYVSTVTLAAATLVLGLAALVVRP